MANEIQFPTSPTNGNIYSMGGRNYRYDSAQDKFVAVATATIVEGGGVTIYATIDDLPLSGNTQGDLAHVTANNTLYFWNGSGWYKIALINNSPSISNVNSSYTLSDIGADTVITMIAEDPEGLAITYSIASDTSGNTATVVQGTGANTNIFTITPSTDANDNGTFSLTFRASDGVNIATAPASFTLNILTIVENSNYTHALFSPIVSTDSLDNKTILDSSSSSHTITTSGNATQTGFSPFRAGGYSTYFDGTGDYITAPSNTSFDFGTDNFTIETWINIPDVTSTWLAFISRGYAQNGGWRLYKNTGNNNLRFYYTDGGTTSYIEASSTGLTNNTWHHITVVRNSSTTKIYVDGVEKGSGTISTSLNPGSYAIEIGSGVVESSYPITGYMTDVRIVKGTAVYTSAFTPPIERLTAIANTSLLTCHLPYIADGSTTGHSITVNGDTKTEAWSPYDKTPYNTAENGGSIYFDGSSRVEAPDSADWNQDTDFTIEAWFYPRSIPANYVHMFGQWQSGGGSNRNTQLTLDPNGRVFMTVNRSGTNYSTPLGTTLKINNWYHVAVTLNGTTLTVWVNGKNDGSTTVGGSTNNSAMGWAIGGEPGSGSYPFTGFIADTRVVKGSAIYTANFTPPTAPLTAITNTKLLLNGTNAGVFDKSSVVGTHDVYAGIESSTTQTKFNSASIRFDGSGHIRMHFGLNARRFYTEDFTIEAWVYRDVQNVKHALFASAANYWLGGSGFGVFIDSNNELIFTNNNITTSSSGLNFPANTWKHVAVARDYDQVRMFVDGTLVATYVRNWSMTDGTMRIGTQSSQTDKFSGYMDDIRVTHGLARYTANFTPPTAALEG